MRGEEDGEETHLCVCVCVCVLGVLHVSGPMDPYVLENQLKRARHVKAITNYTRTNARVEKRC